MKKKMSVLIDINEIERARKNGLNISTVCTNALKNVNDAIEQANGKNKGFLTPDSFTKEDGVRSPGFEPGSSAWEGNAENWIRFRDWLKSKNYNRTWESTIFNYAQEFSDCLFRRDLTKIRDLKDSKRPNVLKALSSLAKFTGHYEDWKSLVKGYGLTWSGRSADDVFIDRLTSIQNPDEVWEWIKTIKTEKPGLSYLLDLMAFSGLRFVEGVNSFNLIITIARTEGLNLVFNNNGKNRISGYYNTETSSLEHFWFKDIFIRNSKKAFVSFTPHDLISKISKSESLASTDAVQKVIQKLGLPLRFGDIREANGTFMTKFLKESEINFLHGRVTSSVFMANYFNPSQIVDLKERAFKGISEIQEKIKI